MRKGKPIQWVLSVALVSLMLSCNSSKTEPKPAEPVPSEITGQELFQLLTASGFTYYQNTSAPRASVSEFNAHASQVSIRFNAKAQSALDSSGKLPIGATFPDSSYIVKEVYNGSGQLTMYAAMYKLPKDKNAASGWVWTELSPSGAIIFPVASGAGCVPCHSRTGHIDLVRTFGVF